MTLTQAPVSISHNKEQFSMTNLIHNGGSVKDLQHLFYLTYPFPGRRHVETHAHAFARHRGHWAHFVALGCYMARTLAFITFPVLCWTLRK